MYGFVIRSSELENPLSSSEHDIAKRLIPVLAFNLTAMPLYPMIALLFKH